MSDAVDTVQRTIEHARLRLSSLALAAAFSFAVAGLVAADRAMTASRRGRVQTSATESAALVEGFLEMHAQALVAMRGLHMNPEGDISDEEFATLLEAMRRHATSFRLVWLTDSAGIVRHTRLYGGGGATLPPRVDLDTMSALGMRELARHGRASDSTLVSLPGTLADGEYGFVMLQPQFVNGRFVGFAGGTVTGESVLATVHARAPLTGVRHIVLAGSDTLTADEPLPAPVLRSARAMVRVPGGGSWYVVTEVEAAGWRRAALWSVGLVMLGALLVALVHERRQGIRLAERSAELERLSTELLRANRAKSEFLNNISHELRTPLNAIVGFAEMLRDGVYGDLAPRQSGPVERIASSATHLRHLVDQVLDLAKMTAGRLEVHAETVDLRAMTLDVASEVEPLLEARGLNFSLSVGATLPRVRTDPMHLRQILLNLVSNAIKYTRTGGVAIRGRLVQERDAPAGLAGMGARQPRQWVALAVADTGIGVARADFERIFDEFEQVNAGSRGESMQRGTGLGLPISRRLARLLGGEITIESEVGKGSTFTIWLPADPGDVRITTAEHRVPQQAAAGKE
ncbi:MAG TPA: HAMP domain-containing sensor histidine kinase [Gemmatimonadaceae bacterium]|nr:HAMP domain-containing sensor histidine kinase [Gemmatimonadaceae bacterium]